MQRLYNEQKSERKIRKLVICVDRLCSSVYQRRAYAELFHGQCGTSRSPNTFRTDNLTGYRNESGKPDIGKKTTSMLKSNSIRALLIINGNSGQLFQSARTLPI